MSCRSTFTFLDADISLLTNLYYGILLYPDMRSWWSQTKSFFLVTLDIFAGSLKWPIFFLDFRLEKKQKKGQEVTKKCFSSSSIIAVTQARHWKSRAAQHNQLWLWWTAMKYHRHTRFPSGHFCMFWCSIQISNRWQSRYHSVLIRDDSKL